MFVKKHLGGPFLWKNVLLKDLPLNPPNINFNPPISGADAADDFLKVRLGPNMVQPWPWHGPIN